MTREGLSWVTIREKLVNKNANDPQISHLLPTDREGYLFILVHANPWNSLGVDFSGKQALLQREFNLCVCACGLGKGATERSSPFIWMLFNISVVTVLATSFFFQRRR